MAYPEQDSTSGVNNARRLVFDEKKGKWRMESTRKRKSPHRGHPISEHNEQSLREGGKRFWQMLFKPDNAPLYQQHTDKISDGLKSYWQERKKQQHNEK